MTPRKLFIGVARFPYGGNGGTACEHPAVADWLCRVHKAIHDDERCEPQIAMKWYADTPITMTRNLALREARARGVDVLVMVDSDQWPDLRLSYDCTAKPFWESSFDFLYRHYDRGPCVIAAPYCGPPPHPLFGGYSNVYVFTWTSGCNEREAKAFGLRQFQREEAALRAGIEKVAALPTGLCMVDLRICEKLDPPWFDYEWEDRFESAKGSTEDVFFTRNLSLLGIPQYVNWDAWAGHVKGWVADKPDVISVEEIQVRYAEAIRRGAHLGQRITDLAPDRTAMEIAAELGLPPPVELTEPGVEGQRLPAAGSRELAEIKQALERANLKIEPQRDASGRSGTADFLPLGDAAALRRLAAEAARRIRPRPVRILEVGSWTGASAYALLSGLNGDQGTLHCVDTWAGSPNDDTGALSELLGGPEAVKKIFLRNLETEIQRGRVEIHQGHSTHVAEHWSGGPFDLMFFDANHSREGLAGDISAWRKHLASGGVMAGHDHHTPGFDGVQEALREAFPEGVEVESNVWYTRPAAELSALEVE